MRPGERAIWERLGDIVKLGERRGLPVICNGDGNGWENWDKIRTETGELANCMCPSVRYLRVAVL